MEKNETILLDDRGFIQIDGEDKEDFLQNIVTNDLKKIGIVDEIITEPIGGAHQDYDKISSTIKLSLLKNIAELSKFSQEELLQRRYQRLLKIGA